MEWSQAVGADRMPPSISQEGVSGSSACLDWHEKIASLKDGSMDVTWEPAKFPDIEVDCHADGTPAVLRYAGRTFRLVEEM